MKSQDPTERGESLGRALRDWKVAADLPSRFQDEVWRRIALSEVRRATGFWTAFLQSIETALLRPGVAIAYVAILLLVGVSIGMVEARQASARMDETLEARYLQSVDPYHAGRN